MRADRRTQPYRRGARQPGAALTAMLKGTTAQGQNPMDVQRAAQRLVAASKSRQRPQRPSRPHRPQRPSR